MRWHVMSCPVHAFRDQKITLKLTVSNSLSKRLASGFIESSGIFKNSSADMYPCKDLLVKTSLHATSDLKQVKGIYKELVG